MCAFPFASQLTGLDLPMEMHIFFIPRSECRKTPFFFTIRSPSRHRHTVLSSKKVIALRAEGLKADSPVDVWRYTIGI